MVDYERNIDDNSEPFHGSDEEECKENMDEVLWQHQLLKQSFLSHLLFLTHIHTPRAAIH